MNKQFMALLATAALFGACNPSGKEQGPKEDILKANLDTTVSPADDFFEYAEGGWIKKNSIPADESIWGIGYLVNNELYQRKMKINEDAVKEHAKSGTSQQVADFWISGMDTVSIEKNGVEPLRPELNKIAALKTPEEAMSFAAHMHTYGTGVFFSEGVTQDQMNSNAMTYYMGQGGIGLPNRDYYFNTDSRTTKIREAYPAFIARIFTLMGVDSGQAGQKAKNIVAFETELARASRKLADLRDPYKNYNKVAISKLGTLAPHTNWPQHLKEIGVHSIDSVIVGQPEFYQQLDKLLVSTDMQTIRDYMSFHLVRGFAPYMSKAFSDASFDFYSRQIRGAEQQRPRWKRVLDAQEGVIGEAVGKLFAKEYFNEKAKARYSDLVEAIRNAYKTRIEKLDWMTDSTKQKAIHKLMSMKKKVGYPDKWKDFSSLKIDQGPYVMNILRANEWENTYELNKLGKPVDREEWDMTPQTYNAYYNPSNNEIVLPAGQFTVPGYRDEQLDDALVYGYAAASTIGHEITHGFDDEGRQYDENGNLHNWWSPQDSAQFVQRAEVLVRQFNGMVAVDTIHINGRASLGENLADLGGILIGVDAFKNSEAFKKNENINGLTPMQRFFLGYSLGWMYQIRKEQLASQVMTDVHAPAKFRVNGPLPNVPAFYEAFSIKPGDKMYLPDSLRVRLW